MAMADVVPGHVAHVSEPNHCYASVRLVAFGGSHFGMSSTLVKGQLGDILPAPFALQVGVCHSVTVALKPKQSFRK